MKTRVTATAQTSYQMNSLRSFNFDHTIAVGNRSCIGWSDFETKKEAIAYLRSRAEQYYEDRRELREALQDVKVGVLTLDAVTAYCEPINKIEE